MSPQAKSSGSQLRILFVTNMYPSIGHPSDGIFVQRQVSALGKLPGITVDVVYLDTVRSTLAYATGRRAVQAALGSFRPDLVHIHYGLTQLAVPKLGVPSVVTFHGSDLAIRWQRWISLGLLASRDGVVLVSEAMRDLVPPRVLAEVVPSSVDGAAIRLACERGHDEPCRPGAPVTIVFGSSPERPEKDFALFTSTVEVLRSTYGLQVCTVIARGLKPSDVPQLLTQADLLLLTSKREGSPTITKEALCCGTRVVSTAVGDMNFQLHGLSGCRVAQGRTPQLLAAAVVEALAESAPDPAPSLARYDSDACAGRLAAFYTRVLEGAS